MISQLTCPVCRTKVQLDGNRSMPFCSERCRLIDLGRWLEEDIGVPVDNGSDGTVLDDESPSTNVDISR